MKFCDLPPIPLNCRIILTLKEAGFSQLRFLDGEQELRKDVK